jgi:endonuclease YncB( thermonuclease family)
MMARKKKHSTLMVILTLVFALSAWYIKAKHPYLIEGFTDESASSESVDGLSEVKLLSEEFDILKNSSLVSHRNNDGDSFHVKHGDKETEFRLYFVDAAESEFKEYRDGDDNGKRIREQGDYFGGLDRQATTKLGKLAKSFVADLISQQDFTVVTKWENVYTPERKYCYVIVNWEGKQVYLHELLVAKGLARIKTRGATLPDDTSFYDQKEKLKKMEQTAKNARLGAWGM